VPSSSGGPAWAVYPLISSQHSAPKGPGDEARWTTANKSGIGTAIEPTSRVWFTTARGIVTEVFYPMPDRPCVRAMGFTVTQEGGFFSEGASTLVAHGPGGQAIALACSAPWLARSVGFVGHIGWKTGSCRGGSAPTRL
jgi:hypothetical protein